MILPTLIMKNFRILFRHFFIFFLIIFTPILVLLATGSLYSYISYTVSFDEVGVILLDESITLQDIQEVLNSDDIEVFNSIEECTLTLKRYEKLGCISFTQEGEFLYATLYVNPIDDLAARTVTRNFEVVVQRQNLVLSTDVIELSLDEMRVQAQDLNTTIQQLEILTQQLEDKTLELQQTKELITNSLISQQEIISIVNQRGEEIQELLKEFEESQLEPNIIQYQEQIAIFEANISSLKLQLEEFKNEFRGNDSSSAANTATLSIIDLIIDKIEAVEAQFQKVSNDLDTVLDLSINTQNLLNSSSNELIRIEDELENSITQTRNLINIIEGEEENLQELTQIIIQRTQDLKKTYKTLQSSLEVGSEEILSPISTSSTPIITDLTQFQTRLPFIFALLFLLVSPFLSSILVHYEFYGNSYQRIELSQTPLFLFYLAIFVTAHIITLFKFILLFIIVNFFFEPTIFESINYMLLLFYFVLINSVLILFGMMYGRVFSKSHVASLMLIFTCIFLILISQIVFPSFLFPQTIQFFLSLNPVDVFISMFKKELFFPQEQSFNWFVVLYSVIAHGIFYYYFKNYSRIKNSS